MAFTIANSRSTKSAIASPARNDLVRLVRVDLYDVGHRIYFGEMTTTPGGGFARFDPKDMDEHLGQLWRGGLPLVNKSRGVGRRAAKRATGGQPSG